VTVDIQSDAYISVSEHGLHGLGGFPEFEHQGGKGMPSVVQANTRAAMAL
jgi:hypothetical protein